MAHDIARRYKKYGFTDGKNTIGTEHVIECSCGWTEKAYREQLVDARFVRHREGK